MNPIAIIKTMFNPADRGNEAPQQNVQERNPWITEDELMTSLEKLQDASVQFAPPEVLKSLCSVEYLNPPKDGIPSADKHLSKYAKAIQKAVETADFQDDAGQVSCTLVYATLAQIFLRKALQSSWEATSSAAWNCLTEDPSLVSPEIKTDNLPEFRRHPETAEQQDNDSIIRALPELIANRILKCCDALLVDTGEEHRDWTSLFSPSEYDVARHVLVNRRLEKALCSLCSSRRFLHFW